MSAISSIASTPAMTVMIAAVRKAARGVQRDYGEIAQLQVSKKGPGNYVTAADRACEKTLREELLRARPDYSILGEEEGSHKGSDPDHRFIIDPIDGTANFMRAIPHFAVTIALERKGEIVAGVTYNPVSDELFHAEKGVGAFMNNKRMRVGARKALHECVIATDVPANYGPKSHVKHRNQLAVMQARSAAIRATGSTALDLCYVACSRFDGLWTQDVNAWDVAAGLLFVRESGGFIADLTGKNDALNSGNIAVGNADILPLIQASLVEAAKLPA
jgi:myo-inositol-1(or 4)-monophosphatase